MRAQFGWEMTDDLVRHGNAVLLRHLLRGLTWPRALTLWLLALAMLIVTLSSAANWIWILLAGAAMLLFLLILLIAIGMPRLQQARLEAYLKKLADWPHRRVALAITPDAIEMTTPLARGLVELSDLNEIVHDPQTTVLLFRGGLIVPVPTAVFTPEARQLLRFPDPAEPGPPSST